MFASRRVRRRKPLETASTEALETRTMLTAGLTVSQFLTTQVNDSGRIQTFVEAGRISENTGERLQAQYDKAIADAQDGRMGRAATKFEKFTELANDLVDQGRLSRQDANELITTGFFDRDGSDFDILRQAVADTGLTSLLNRPNSEFTTFAPTDRAFRYLAEELGYEGTSEVGAYNAITSALGTNRFEKLSRILQAHVIRPQRAKQWLMRTEYQEGDKIQYRGDFFTATEDHNSGSRFRASNWEAARTERVAPQQSLSVDELVRTESVETFGEVIFKFDGRVILDNDTELRDAKIN